MEVPFAGLQNYLLFQVENMPAARKEDMGPEIWKLSEISAPPGNVHLRRQGSLCVTYWYCLRHLKTLYFTNTHKHLYFNLIQYAGGSLENAIQNIIIDSFDIKMYVLKTDKKFNRLPGTNIKKKNP